MRIIVVGAGAIGGPLAVGLHEAGIEVEVVARGAHLDAIRSRGLTRVGPDGRTTVRLPAHARVSEARVDPATVVALATKVHQVEPVLDELLAHAGPDVAVAGVHNGVEGERLAARRFRQVHGVLVNTPGVHLVEGEVEIYATPPRGVLDVGSWPSGVDHVDRDLAAAFTAAGFLSEACEVWPRRWAKLLGNVGNALEVLCGPDGEFGSLYQVVREEAAAVLDAAGIGVDLETQQRRADMVARADVDGVSRPGGSTWQSAVRGGALEVTALNGEICLLGRLHGVPTPANDLVQSEALALAAAGDPVGSRRASDLLARLARPAPTPHRTD